MARWVKKRGTYKTLEVVLKIIIYPFVILFALIVWLLFGGGKKKK